MELIRFAKEQRERIDSFFPKWPGVYPTFADYLEEMLNNYDSSGISAMIDEYGIVTKYAKLQYCSYCRDMVEVGADATDSDWYLYLDTTR